MAILVDGCGANFAQAHMRWYGHFSWQAQYFVRVSFKYDERVEQPRAFEKFFYSLSRRGEQTLMSYRTEHRECLREVLMRSVVVGV